MPRAELLSACSAHGGADGLLCMLSDAVDGELLAATAGRLKSVATMSVGVSHIAPAVTSMARIGYTPDVLNDATADLVLGLTLATLRRIPEAASAVKGGLWKSWSPFWLTGKDLSGTTVGVIGGSGRIGRCVIQRLSGFTHAILYSGSSSTPSPAVQAAFPFAQHTSLDTLLSTSDVVIVICALTEGTRGLLNAARLERMKPDATLINASRGEVVVQDDLIALCHRRPGFSVGLDVTTPEPLPLDSPLLALENVVVLPHIGSAATSTRMKMASMSVANLLAGLDGVAMPAELPATEARWKAGH